MAEPREATAAVKAAANIPLDSRCADCSAVCGFADTIARWQSEAEGWGESAGVLVDTTNNPRLKGILAMQAFRARDALNAQADEGTVRLHNWYQNCPGYDDERDECGVTAALELPYNEDILDWLHHGIDLHPNTGSEE